WLERKPTLDLKASFIHVFKLSGDKTLPGTLAPMGVIESIPDSIEAVKKAVTDEYGSGDYVLRGISENEKTGERRF
ncbi:MAG: hypothetical protein GWN41_11210, partial [Phycisphaerae bacterium]|nr:hypothetical protein [Phycisphaerae bacterium]